MLSFSLTEDVSEQWTFSFMTSGECPRRCHECVNTAVMWSSVGAGHGVTQSRVTTPSPPSVSQQPGQPPVFARRQGKVPIFTHFSGSLIQEFSYSLEFSYSHTLLMNLQWDTFTWPARPRHRPALLYSHQITHAIKSIQAEAKSKATVYCSDTRYLRNYYDLLWCFCNIHLCMCMFHLAPCAMEASLW